MIKKISIMLMAVLLLFSVTVSAHAIESPDLDRKGTLTLVMEWEGEKLNGGTLTIYRVGQIVLEDDAWKFILISELRERGISLEDMDDAQLAKQLNQLVKEKVLPGSTVPIRGGEAVFTNLEAGLYLVTQEEACEGFSPINPFLTSLPRWENGRYVYDLTAQPKVSLESLPTQPSESTEPEPTEPAEPELPQTGQLNWPVPVMTMAGLSLFALGCYLCYGKKNSHES